MSRIFFITLVGFGGLFGSIARYLISVSLSEFKIFSIAFPYGTFAVNILGCFLIGIFYGLSKTFNWFDSSVGLFLITGFCGGFTTFSSFGYENIDLIQKSEYLTFAGYSTGSFVLGLFAVFAGLMIAKYIF